MKIIVQTLTSLFTLCLVAGCGPSSNDRSANDSSDTSATASRSDTLSPTSRETNSSSRSYSRNSTNTGSYKDADNTGRNARDRSDATLTPGDQGSSDSDREITRGVRRTLNTNDQFSTMAKNIKIITVNGKVPLRGPVNSEQERQAIAAAAQSAAGTATIDDQLEVKANQ